jgi:hypothetical protein
MVLFINTGNDYRTGWEGHDIVLNRVRRDPSSCIVERSAGGWKWKPIAKAPLVVAGNELHLAVARGDLGLEKDPVRFDFKWADNTRCGDIMSFITDGDVAPNGRFHYHFEE